MSKKSRTVPDDLLCMVNRSLRVGPRVELVRRTLRMRVRIAGGNVVSV